MGIGIKVGTSGQINNNIVTDGLVFYVDAAYKKSYVSGSTTTNSLVGNITGSLVNDVGFSTENQGTWDFDGVNDYSIGNTPISLNLSQPVTINTWFYFNNFFPGNPRIIECQDSNHSIQIIRDGSSNTISTKNNNFQTGNNGTTWFTPTTGVWYNVTCVWIPSSSTTILYSNGVSQTGTFFSNIAAGNQPNKTVLGVRSDFQSTTWLNGNISNVQVYNRALSPEEVQQNYNAGKGRFDL